MAAMACKHCFRFEKNLQILWTQAVRFKSDVHVAVTEDSSTVVFWHPEKKFPYEMTLPVTKKPQIENDSVLKLQSHKEFLTSLKSKKSGEIAKELARITHTTMHIWFPPKFQFRRKKKPENDRPYL